MGLIPKVGTLERKMLDKLVEKFDAGEPGVTYFDFTPDEGITEENIDLVVQNLRNGIFESEDDDLIRFDS